MSEHEPRDRGSVWYLGHRMLLVAYLTVIGLTVVLILARVHGW